MAQIRPYESPIDTLHPSEGAQEAYAQAGRRVGAFYHQEGEEIGGAIKQLGDTADRFEAHQEISHGALGLAGLQQDLTQKWNDAAKNADPNDPSTAAKFQKETLEPALEQFQNGFISDAGSRWAMGRVDEIRNHFFEKTTADMSTLAGQAVKTNLEQVSNAHSVTAHDDPSSIFTILDHIDASVGGLVGTATNLTPEQAGSAKSQIAQSMKEQAVQNAVKGAIEKNPDHGLDLANDSRLAPYLKKDELSQFATYAQAQQRIARAYDNQQRIETDRQQTEAVNGGIVKTVQNFVTVGADGKARVDPKFFQQLTPLSNMPGVKPQQLSELFAIGQKFQEQGAKEPTDDPMTKGLLQQKLLEGDDITEDLVRARTADKITTATMKETMEMQSDLRKDPTLAAGFKPMLDAAKATITATVPGMPGKDAKGEALYADFVNDFVSQIAKMPPGEARTKAMSTSDPNSLYNQLLSSPKYQRTMQQKLQDLQLSMGSTEASTPIAEAIHGQESGGAATAPTSVTGARGGWQVEPQTFSQYARPGENIDNPKDNEAVGRRIIADYQQRFGNDPARVAVAYYSGPNNVAPPGSPTPYIRDLAGPEGKRVSSYVADVLARQKKAQ